MRTPHNNALRKIFLPLLFLITFNTLACATTQIARPNSTATIAFHVTPSDLSHVVIYVDDHYYGALDKWADGVVRLDAGERRVKIDAPGYIPQRFDFNVKSGEHLTFSIELEPDIDAIDSPESVAQTLGLDSSMTDKSLDVRPVPSLYRNNQKTNKNRMLGPIEDPLL